MSGCDFESLLTALRKGLADRSNFLVAKAAEISAEAYLTDLVPDLLIAFERLLVDTDDDAGCRAKLALAALRDLDHRDPAVFLAGLSHIQLEPVWGEMIDTAGRYVRRARSHLSYAASKR